jgi:signal transduction histidine kinase/DNA-binding response OmpR family regulator
VKKAIAIAVTGIVLLILSNIYYYRDTYFWQIDTQRHVLKKEILICSDEIDGFFKKSQTNVMLLISKQQLANFFRDPGNSKETQKRFELLYNRYAEYLTELRIYDQQGHRFSMRKGTNNTFVTTIETGTIDNSFTPKTTIDIQNKQILYAQPLVLDKEVYGGVEFSIDIDAFFKNVFHTFNLDHYQLQWITDVHGNILYNTLPVAFTKTPKDDKFLSNLRTGKSFDLIHRININGKSTKTLSIVQPLSFRGGQYFVVFSLPTDLITISIARNTFMMAIISLAIVLGIFFMFGRFLKKRAKSDRISKQNQEALRKMIYYLPAGILLIDHQQKIASVNRAFLKLFDFEDEDMLIGHPLEESLIFANIKLINKDKFSDYSYKYVVQNGELNETVVINEKIPYYLEQKRYLVDVYTEIPVIPGAKSPTAQRHAQTAFIANISHELRTPLNGIIGMSDLLSNSPMPAAEAEMLGILKRSADTLLLLINDILDFSKIESGKFDIESIAFDIKAELESTIQGFVPMAKEKGIVLTYHIPVQLPNDFIGDPVRFRQVLNNLLSNAIKFTEKGKVHLLVSKTQLLNGNSGLLFSVKDTGIGIEKEKQKFIFNSFYQADESSTRKYGGTGLGTTISKELVQLMGGEIWVNSPCDLSTDPDYPGSEFCFSLPLKTRRQAKNANTHDVRDFAQLRAIVVTDDALQVQTISQNFTALKVDFRVLSPTQETIDLLRTTKRYHLVVVDNRPDFNGIEFMQELFNHQLQKNFIVLFQSSDSQRSNTNLAKRLGADAYLRKPIRLVVLRDFLVSHFPNIADKSGPVLPLAQPRPLKILVAEDNKLNQKVAQNLFKKIGYTIELANDGAEAVEKVKSQKYDIIFMDIFMPSLDGIEAVKAIKSIGIGCPIVAMTASIDPYEKQRALAAGMDDYISKPARSDDILRMITKWCNRTSM